MGLIPHDKTVDYFIERHTEKSPSVDSLDAWKTELVGLRVALRDFVHVNS